MAVEITTDTDTGSDTVLRSVVPRRLFERDYVGTSGDWGGFGVAPDRERFLMHKQEIDPGEGGELILVLNWFDELEHLAPAG